MGTSTIQYNKIKMPYKAVFLQPSLRVLLHKIEDSETTTFEIYFTGMPFQLWLTIGFETNIWGIADIN